MQKQANVNNSFMVDAVAMKIDSIRKRNVKLTAFKKLQTKDHHREADFDFEI